MEAGKLRHYVTIRTPSATQDTYGEEIPAWTAIATDVPASIEPLTGREFFDAQRVNAEVTHKVIMRYRDDLKPEYRIEHDSRVLEVVSVLNTFERGAECVLMCRELVT